MMELEESTFRKAMADAFRAGRESGIFDLELELLGLMPLEGNNVYLINLGDIAHVYTAKGYVRLDSLVVTH